jgi:polar amino acid transport system substrate-binding protein
LTDRQAPLASADVVRDLAPGGVLRAAINFGNSVLAQRNGEAASGVSVDLARELGRSLGVPAELVAFDAAGKVVEAMKTNLWDIAFLAIDPKRSSEILFGSPYVLIEGAYLVRSDSAMLSAGDVDSAGVRVGAGSGAAYELFLSRTLQHARVDRFSTAREAFQALADGELEAAAGVRQVVEGYAQENRAMRVLSPSFMVIQQAIGTPAGRTAGADYIRTFTEQMKSSGFVSAALARSGQGDVIVAPPCVSRPSQQPRQARGDAIKPHRV